MRGTSLRALAAPDITVRINGAVYSVAVPSVRTVLLSMEEEDFLRQLEIIVPAIPWTTLGQLRLEVLWCGVLRERLGLGDPSGGETAGSKKKESGKPLTLRQTITYYSIQTHTSVVDVLDMPWSTFRASLDDLNSIREAEAVDVGKQSARGQVDSDGGGNVTVGSVDTSSGPRMSKEAGVALRALGILGVPASRARTTPNHK